MKYFSILLILIYLSPSLKAQEIDSTIVGTEYPYALPILGKKAWERGFRLPLPHGVMVNTLFNKQNLVLEDFELAFQGNDGSTGEFVPLDGILDFGPSSGRINTLNFRADTWVFPFLSVGVIGGKIWGEQTISFSFLGSDLVESVTDINGNYFGIGALAVAPLGPVVLGVDYTMTWTTNERLDKPVRAQVMGTRLIRRIKTNKPQRFLAFWGGAQFQKLGGNTSGRIAFQEALGISDDDLERLDSRWSSFRAGEIPNGNGEFWTDLNAIQQQVYESAYNLVRGVSDSTVLYKFKKRLEYDWNMVIGGSYQHNQHWSIRTEYGFLRSKRQVMVSLEYRFGL